MAEGISIGFIGEIGIVGNELIEILNEKKVPVKLKKLLLVEKHLAQEFPADDENFDMEFIDKDSFAGLDLAIIFGHEDNAVEHAKPAADAGCLVLDATGVYGADPRVPLISAVVNPKSTEGVKQGDIAALPLSISVSISAVLKPFSELGNIEQLSICSFHSVSDLGREAMEELTNQSISVLNFQTPLPDIFPDQLAFNCLPQVGPFDRSYEHTVVEEDIAEQVPRLLNLDAELLKIGVTSLQLPIFYGHSFSVSVVMDRDIGQAKVAGALSGLPYLKFIDTSATRKYPHPAGIVGTDRVHIGRLRRIESWPEAWQLWASTDNFRFGAALNICEIIKRVFTEKLT